ncbi:neither inactivation nor afterpotential protein G [Teleopsis dalmanni]|uniref:neither inactivation nor afterpotential protein G n=1 Tax=Teleopsis dalmanni TaxID=139649 RepID=UPI0018CE0FAD|nr:neither inactivation nor afterpotential protein G [Teleopsis dalmanni]
MQFQKIVVIGACIIACLSFLWLLLCKLLEERVSNTLEPAEGYVFDYVIVGAGTAGSVVASLLAKYSNSTVLLVEAGDKFGFLSKIPLLTTLQQKGVNDWSFLSVPQKHSSRGLKEQRQCLPRGRGLGGSSQLNYMLHFDGYPQDFYYWYKTHNLSTWRWDFIKPYLDAVNPSPNEMYEIRRDYSKLTTALHLAEEELIHKPWLFRRARYNIKKGLRYNVFQHFLKPAFKYKNLHIITNAMAKRIELKKDKKSVKSLLIGVKDEYTRKEKLFTVDIREELILSAGAYQSPQLLLVSGIGDYEQLEKLNIKLQKQLPKVGTNLHDHLNQPLFVSIEVIGPTLNQKALLDPYSLFNYLSSGTGHLGNFGVLAHVDDIFSVHNFGLTFFAAGAIDETALMSISNFKREHFRALFPRYHNSTQEGFVIISTCTKPKSRGSVTISNSNIRKNPLINPNYLSKDIDVNCTIEAIRAAVEIITSEAFANLRPRIHWPKIKNCAKYGPFELDFVWNKPSDSYLECILRHVGLGSHHPAGTCSMGSTAMNSVVDAEFRVHGLKNLRVIDASVIPIPLSGNPNSVVSALAVRGVTMILKMQLNENINNNP